MQWEPYVKRYVEGERDAKPRAALLEQLHTLLLTEAYGFDA